MKALLVSLALACGSASASPSAEESPFRERMRIHDLESEVLASLRNQDNASESFGEGGVSGGTHLLLGTAMAVGGTWLMLSLGKGAEDNAANDVFLIAAPVVAIGGVAEMVYGVVKMIRTRNQIH